MPNVLLSNRALNEFMYWAHNDRKILDKIDALLNDIERNGAAKGLGKPERLKMQGNVIAVKSCKGHYDDK